MFKSLYQTLLSGLVGFYCTTTLAIHLLMFGKDSKEAAKTALMGKNNVGGGDFEAPTSLIPRDTERTIAKTVKEQNIDIQIMGAYAHSPICSLLFGSKIADLLRSVTIPTILLC